MYVPNPLHATPSVAISNHENTVEGGNQTADDVVTRKRVWSVSSSTPFQPPAGDNEATALSVAKFKDAVMRLDHGPVDMIVSNPLFGSGVDYNQV